MSTTAEQLTRSYLATLELAAPATIRQRRWALGDLTAYAEQSLGHAPSATEITDEQLLTSWLAHTADSASHAGQRARAAAARALRAHAAAHNLTPPDHGGRRLLRLPETPPARIETTRGRHLLAAAMGAPPFGVPFAVWARFCAHTHLLAATGAPERHLAILTTSDITPAADAVRTAAGWADLRDASRHVLTRWLEARAALVASLQGADPHALWLRTHPGVDRRTKAIAPAGLPISTRGLRLSFSTVIEALAVEDPDVADVTLRDVRALGRLDDLPTPRPLAPDPR